MKRESYKTGPRFGPDAWDYRNITPKSEQQEAKAVEKQPVVEVPPAAPIVEVPPAAPVVEVPPILVVEPAVQEIKAFDKKKK